MTLHMYCITTKKKANNLIALRKKKSNVFIWLHIKKIKLNQQIETWKPPPPPTILVNEMKNIRNNL